MTVRVKICGVRTLEDAAHACEVGADLLGFNLVPSSPRFLSPEAICGLVRELRELAVARGVEFVGVVADFEGDLTTLLTSTGLDTLQLHGSEGPAQLEGLLPRAYKALRIGDATDVRDAERYPGRRLLVDAKVRGQLGGTGARFDWNLLEPLRDQRDLLLAGGLDAENVEEAVRTVGPWAVDVASGVESAPGVKDPVLVESFVRRAHVAARER